MSQNIGLFFLTVGSILLSVNVFWGKYFSSWKELPWEQRLFFKLTGGRLILDLERQSKELEKVLRYQNDPEYKKKMDRRAKWHKRIVGDLPILAIMLMIVGFYLSMSHGTGATMSGNLINLLLWVIGVGIGGLITYGVSRQYYVKAANDLNEATKKLGWMTSTLARLLEGMGKANYDEKGMLTGTDTTLKVNNINIETKVSEIGDLHQKKAEDSKE